jgi:pantoate--beta-alanine ligase
MKIFHGIQEIREYVLSQKLLDKTIGFVPTMGALHMGHQRLVEYSVNENETTICSIFVNPTQFNNPHDLQNYPRDLASDIALLTQARCDAVFAPDVSEMYQTLTNIRMDFGRLESTMEGSYRPGHFNGVGIVVAKLFNIINPDKAYFGKKDLQQLAVIKSLVRDLAFNVEIVPVETVREPDGLAMSSRNRLLTDDERKIALNLYDFLLLAKENLLKGLSPAEVKADTFSHFETIEGIKLEYFQVVDSATLHNIESINSVSEVSLCIAAHVGKVRLIDNMSLK